MANPLQIAQWLNPPQNCDVTDDAIVLRTEPQTDFWQRTFYGFRAANAPAALVQVEHNVSFTVRVTADYRGRYDQAGVILWIDEQNWFKASIEYENAEGGRLGSVLTTGGHSDWATRDVATVPEVWFRLSRRGPDFLLEAKTAQVWEQLRVFHVAALGPTDPQWGALPAAEVPAGPVALGVYACSPEQSSFTARFDEMTLAPSGWAPHS